MGRYRERTTDNSLETVVATVVTGIPFHLLGGPSYRTEITDTKTGRTGSGWGSSKREAHDRAWKDLEKKSR